MNDLKIEPYNDSEKVKRLAEQYIDRIFLEISLFERYHDLRRPTIYMSLDIMSIIARGTETAIKRFSRPERCELCGYEVELAAGKNVLGVGFSLLGRGLDNEQREAD